ncbi:uncharacterized protein AMSG_07061, partial [Thecamonas trahens ATCC 50062]
MIQTFSSRVSELLPLLTEPAAAFRGEYSRLRAGVELMVGAAVVVQLWLLSFQLNMPWRYTQLDKVAGWSLLENSQLPFMLMFWLAASLPLGYVGAFWLARSPLLRAAWHASRLGFFLGRSLIFGILFMPILNYMFQILLCPKVMGSRPRPTELHCWHGEHLGAAVYALAAAIVLIFQAFAEARTSDILMHESSNPLRTARHIVYLRTKVLVGVAALTGVKVFGHSQPVVQLVVFYVAAVTAIVYVSIRTPFVVTVHVDSFGPGVTEQEMERRAQEAAHEVPSALNDVIVGLFTAWLFFLIIASVNYRAGSASGVNATPYFMLLGIPGMAMIGFYLSWARRNVVKRSLPSKRKLPPPGTLEAFWRHPNHSHLVPVSDMGGHAVAMRVLSDAGATALMARLADAERGTLATGFVTRLEILGPNRYSLASAGWRRGGRMSRSGLGVLAPLMGEHSQLQAFKLEGQVVDDECVANFAQALSANASLVALELPNNGISESGLLSLVGIALGTRLARLNLSGNVVDPSARARVGDAVRAMLATEAERRGDDGLPLLEFDDSVAGAVAAVVDEDDSTRWVVLGYQSQPSSRGPNVLEVKATGEDGVEELAWELSDAGIQFALLQVVEPKTSLWKLVFITWVGESSPTSVRTFVNQHTADVAKVFRGYHVQINARSEDDIAESVVLDLVAKGVGADYSAHGEGQGMRSSAPRPKPKPKPKGFAIKVAAKPKCQVCKKDVFPADAVKDSGLTWHKACFRCSTCGLALNLKNFRSLKNVLYCGPHLPKAQHTQVADDIHTRRAVSAPKRTLAQGARVDLEGGKIVDRSQFDDAAFERESHLSSVNQSTENRPSESAYQGGIVPGSNTGPAVREWSKPKPAEPVADASASSGSTWGAPPPSSSSNSGGGWGARQNSTPAPAPEPEPEPEPAADDGWGQEAAAEPAADAGGWGQEAAAEPAADDGGWGEEAAAEPAADDGGWGQEAAAEPAADAGGWGQEAAAEPAADDGGWGEEAAAADDGGWGEEAAAADDGGWGEEAAAADDGGWGEEAAAAEGEWDPSQYEQCRVLYEYDAADDTEISLVEGEIVYVYEKVAEGWWIGGKDDGSEGMFPSNYCELIE